MLYVFFLAFTVPIIDKMVNQISAFDMIDISVTMTKECFSNKDFFRYNIMIMYFNIRISYQLKMNYFWLLCHIVSCFTVMKAQKDKKKATSVR